MKHFTDARQITDTITGLPDVDQEYSGFYSVLPHYYAKNVHWQTNYSDGSGIGVTLTTAHTALMLFTGGKAGVHQLNLIQLQCSGVKYGAPSGTWGEPWLDMEWTTIDPSTMKVLGQSPGSDGNLWVAEPDNAGVALNLTAPWGNPHYGAWATATKHELIHQTVNPALTDTNLARLNLGVGEQVNLSIQPALPSGYYPYWSASAGGLTNEIGSSPTFTAPSNAATAVISLEVMTATITNAFTFNVLEPSEVDMNHTFVTNLFSYPTNPPSAGAGMHLIVYMKPTDVSFYRVWMEEVGEDATNVQGYFTNTYPAPSHSGNGADDPFQIFSDNSWEHGTAGRDWDEAYSPGYIGSGSSTLPQPWSTGQFTWNVPWNWGMSSNSLTNLKTNGWQQVFTIDASGTMTVSKFGHTVTRTVNQTTGTAN